uniref:PPM-type phosphatase domain-containing protein n=1 Tax=Pyramimonas obovata TaxID=1411642 RepID=A0A7S0R0N5_9CHLO|mmetsp:Transcript_22218/g.48785  ORF Transcript_22218/g.48785 Transcript_22218/m.48785 type:complete len:331 (+) Transcript_22218:95-1087(+)
MGLGKVHASGEFSAGPIKYIVGQKQVVGGRNHNEDRLTVLTDFNAEVGLNDGIPRSYFGCYDGHGGEKCSTYLKDELHKLIAESSMWERQITLALKDAYLKAEVKFLETYNDISSGSCSLSIILQDNKLYIANCGDCRAVMYKGTGKNADKVTELTRDHNPDDEEEMLRIENAGGFVTQEIRVIHGGCCKRPQEQRGAARVQPGSLAVSRSIGDCALKAMHEPQLVIAEPDVSQVELSPSTLFLIIATDGIWGGGGGNLSSEDACKNVLKTLRRSIKGKEKNQLAEMNLAELAAHRLVQEAERQAEEGQRTCDNTSAIIVIFPDACKELL